MNNKLETKDIVVVILIIIAAFVAAGLSIYQYVDGIKKDKDTNELQLKVIKTQEKLIDAQENADVKASENNSKLDIANKELKSKTEDLINSQSEIIRIQNESLKNIIGYGYAELMIEPIDENNFRFYIKSKSAYNMYELLIEITDFDAMKECQYVIKNKAYFFKEECHEKNSVRNTMKTLNSKSYADINYNLNLNKVESHLIIRVVANNITTMQYSIIQHDRVTRIFSHEFKLFEVKRDNSEYVLLSESSTDIPEKEWARTFPYKTIINISK